MTSPVMTDIATRKRELRNQFLARRKALPPLTCAAAAAAILKRLATFPPWLDAESYLCYVASKDNEVDTKPLIEDRLGAGKTVYVPIAHPDRSMSWAPIPNLDVMQPSRFGVLEPPPELVPSGPAPDDGLVIVPGIAFAPSGYRIGYGGGYYDRFLAQTNGTTVAVAYEIQITDSVPVEPHDVPVDWIITEERCIRCLTGRFGSVG